MGNTIKLTDEQIKILENLPEHGMGYQIVNITLKDGHVLKDRIVLNSTDLKVKTDEIITPDEIILIELAK